jgi:branched-chain amino acid transport system substrate-binding protein
MKRALVLAIAACGLAVTTVAAARPDSGGPAAAASPGTTQITCGSTRTIGAAFPITGLAASIGRQQLSWANFFVSRWNRTHGPNIRIVRGDTQLPETAVAVAVAERFASNSQILGVVGPSGSQEVQVSTAPLRQGGLVNVSSSATRTSLTLDGTRRGYFFRTVPNDDLQGGRVARYIYEARPRGLGARRVVIVDAQNSYSVGLSDTVQRLLRARRGTTVRRESVSEATVTDFSSLVARIPANTQIVYVPWQLSSKAQLLGQQLRASGKRATMFGSDGLFDPSTFRIPGSYVSFFPIDRRDPILAAYRRSHRGQGDFFGAPSYAAMDVVARAIERACRDNQATRAEVRRLVNRTVVPAAQSLLGFRIRFIQRRQGSLGPGDMARPADFGIFRINPRGVYVPVA